MKKFATLTFALLLGLTVTGTAHANPARDAIIAKLQAQASQPFSAERGKAFYLKDWSGERDAAASDPETPSCTACHSTNPRNETKHAKTGKVKPPIAVSATPDRFTDPDNVEKWFRRNCNGVLGRECTAQEKGDFLTFMIGQ
ncbi:MAG: hypothetical protein A2516_03105 [Alphaproteobacteria bacterium RIFOXYD12_FULL_60_8]|nr:MAG: hypothetical protein A2516_03105 [Alphaproteobacteria bacterium RIFOXYD12_FULL_60_8]